MKLLKPLPLLRHLGVLLLASMLLILTFLLFDNFVRPTLAQVVTDWQNNGNDTYYDAGNVGIGTDTPLGKLHLKNDPGTNPEIYFESDNARWKFRTTNGNNRFAIIDDVNNTAPFLMDQGAPTHSFRISPTGDVGIGTGAPTEQLQVEGNLKLNGSLLSDSALCIGNCT